MRPRLVTAYIDGSSDSEYNRGGSGVFLNYPDNTASKHQVSAGKIESNFTSALEALKEGKMGLTQEINSDLFSIGELGKSCTLQWIPAQVDIEGNEMADSIANEVRTLKPLTSSTTVFDAKAVAKQKL
ncbi:RNase H domain-containing protein [Trichonephila clavipes]|nr:RNase H domain-containing protein [Trichonephila clavipes]